MLRTFGINTTWDDVKDMTIDEAISILSKHANSDGGPWSARPHMAKACSMAIEALEFMKENSDENLHTK